MTSPYIRLSKAAIEAKFTQNEGLIFHALMVQTLGYRKSVDNLTDKRLAQLAGIRLDHFRPALESFLSYNLFYRIEHRDYDYQYRICDQFLDETQTTIVHPPSLPKTERVQNKQDTAPKVGESTAPTLESLPELGAAATPTLGNFTELGAENPPTLGNPTELGGHTTENLYIKKQQHNKNETTENLYLKKQQQTTKTKTETKPKKIVSEEKQQQQPSVTIFMAGLESLPEQFVIESSQPLRIEFSSARIGQAVEKKQDEAKIETKTETETETKTEILPKAIETVPTAEVIVPEEKAVLEETPPKPKVIPVTVTPSTTTNSESFAQSVTKAVAKLTKNTVLKPIADTDSVAATDTSAIAISEKTVVVNEKEIIKESRHAIPKAVGEENFNACNRYFKILSDQQQSDVLTVFFYNLKLGNIRNKASYFIGLTQKVCSDRGLSVPSEAKAHMEEPLSAEQQEVKKKMDQQREYRAEKWGDYQWIVRQAVSQQKTEAEVAKSMGLEEALMLFGEQPEVQYDDAQGEQMYAA